MGSLLRQTLKRLCCSNGWSYGVFWGFDQRNPMLLTIEDAYYEKEMKTLVDNMFQKFHIFGEGIIGQAALTRSSRWIFSDSHAGNWNSVGSFANENVPQDESEFQSQFSSGIKTIAVISVESRGVIQFGSTQKILERLEFLDQTKKLFNDMGSIDGLILADFGPFSSNKENYDLDGFFPSLLSSGNSSDGILTSEQGGCAGELTGKPCSPRMGSMQQYSSHHNDQLQTMCAEALKTQQQLHSQPFSSVNNSAADTPCTSSGGGGGSVLTSFETLMLSDEDLWDSPFASPLTNSPVLWGSTRQTNDNSTLNSFHRTGGAVDLQKPIEDVSRNSTDSQNSSASVILTDGLLGSVTSLPKIPAEFMPAEYSSDISNFCAVDDFSQWFASSPGQDTNAAGTAIAGDLSCATEVSSLSSGLVRDVLSDIPVKYLTNSVQSSITDSFLSDVRKKSTVVDGNENDPFDSLKFDFGSGKSGECLEDIVMPMIDGNYSAVGMGMPRCISRSDVGCTADSHTGLFSKLGLEALLNTFSSSDSVATSTVEDQVPTTKRRKMESSYSTFNPVDFVGLSCTSRSINLMQHPHNLDRTNSTMLKKEVPAKSQVGLWIDDSYSINVVDNAVGASKKAEEPPKVTKKRAKPGQSTRPRPKDRQMIQDRLRELRGIIPDSGKCSIDSLLDRTVKYMCFLQGVTKYADKLTQADEPKLIGPENGAALKDHRSGGSCGATWAFELGDQTMGCPVIVEDLNPPGQMLIEMLCEDQGFFLEIADIIRGFGLNILKGVMEIREDKIWAHFIVEANKKVTRLDILWSLVQFLQQTATSGINPTKQPSSAMDCMNPLLNKHQQPLLLPSGRLAETLGYD
ncbi:hypothetical protein SLE2022_339220 [Rubroshorea leprosula]